VAALDHLDELVDDGAGLGHALVVALDRQPVAAQADRATQSVAERVEHAVANRGELSRNVVRDIEHLLHGPKCRAPATAHRDGFGSIPSQTCAHFPNTLEPGRRWTVP
jgi:hypothetical protein